MAERRTMLAWFEYLDDRKRELTLEEFMALMLFNIREYGRVTMESSHQTKQATEHLEGMVGAIDEMASRMDPNYAGSGKVREALDAQRDEQRRLTEQARRQALADGMAEGDQSA
jgi:uncharacterized protein (UPF0305 family)